MIKENLCNFVIDNRNNNEVINAMINHIRLTESDETVNRMIDMCLASEEQYYDAFALNGKVWDFKKIIALISKNVNNAPNTIHEVFDVDILAGIAKVRYSYHRTLWYKNEECKGDYSYWKNSDYIYPKTSDDSTIDTTTIDYINNDVFVK